jgi:tRNA threonylcarbamoyladenosine biosynthesis protein TsaE
LILEVKLRLNSIIDTETLAKIIAEKAFKGMIVGLTGDLGSGKTTFTKFFSQAIGVKDNLNSPTFTILKIYEGNFALYHMDVYRLEEVGYDFELDDFIYGDGISVIEWYQYIKEMLPKNIISIDFKVIDEYARDVIIKGEEEYEEIVKAISNRYGN